MFDAIHADVIGAENARLFMRAVTVGKGETESIQRHRAPFGDGHVKRHPTLAELEGDSFDQSFADDEGGY